MNKYGFLLPLSVLTIVFAAAACPAAQSPSYAGVYDGLTSDGVGGFVLFVDANQKAVLIGGEGYTGDGDSLYASCTVDTNGNGHSDISGITVSFTISSDGSVAVSGGSDGGSYPYQMAGSIVANGPFLSVAGLYTAPYSGGITLQAIVAPDGWVYTATPNHGGGGRVHITAYNHSTTDSSLGSVVAALTLNQDAVLDSSGTKGILAYTRAEGLPPGDVSVMIAPYAAVLSGAKWNVDGGPLKLSGAIVSNLSVGHHEITFHTITGWIRPAAQNVVITSGATTMTNGTYVVETGSVEVQLSPAVAVEAGAQWRVDGGSWQNSGATVSNLSLTNHTLSFQTLSGWTTPANQSVAIKANPVAKATGTYIFSANGIYNGLFAQSETNLETMGMLSGLAVTASGTYSGKLLIAGTTNAISGAFNVSGQASNHIARSASRGGPLTLEMTLNWTDSPPNITGTVSGTNGGPWTAGLTAELASKATNSADYTAQVLPPTAPPGYGYLLITNHAGAVTLTGALSDGTAFIQTVPLSGNGDLPVYGSLYGNTGLLTGWLRLEGGSPAGSLAWIKKASRSSALYTNGFTNLVSVTGSVWTNPPAHVAAINLPLGLLSIFDGGLPSPLLFNVAISNNNTLIKLAGSPTNTLTGTNNPKTGLLTITFGNGNGKATTKATGAVLQDTTNAAGFFLGKTNAGSFFLQP